MRMNRLGNWIQTHTSFFFKVLLWILFYNVSSHSRLKWRRTLGFAQAKLSQKTTWRIVQKLQNNNLPARILSTPVTRTSNPSAIIHHCPKITTGNSVALSIRPVRQGNPLLFPQQTTQLSFYETRILVRMPVIRFRSQKTGCASALIHIHKKWTTSHGIISLLEDGGKPRVWSQTFRLLLGVCCSVFFRVLNSFTLFIYTAINFELRLI